jgi:hypothetical protein
MRIDATYGIAERAPFVGAYGGTVSPLLVLEALRHPAQQESFATSLLKPRAASFSPSTVVR